MTRASSHAIFRAGQRLRLNRRLHLPETILDELWQHAREAVPTDFPEFGTFWREGYDYKVAIRWGDKYLIVKGQDVRVYVTVIKKGRVKTSWEQWNEWAEQRLQTRTDRRAHAKMRRQRGRMKSLRNQV